jgi:hypothetical protein
LVIKSVRTGPLVMKPGRQHYANAKATENIDR